jgi:hypothetical protein
MIPTGLDSASSTGIAIRLKSLISRATSGMSASVATLGVKSSTSSETF